MTASRRTLVVAAVAIAVLLLLGANAHLVYVAMKSQPDCVAHLKPGSGGGSGAYAAARSSC